jgi:tellurite resistance protein TehA-like permease
MEVISAMNGMLERLGAVNPLVWVALVLVAVLGYGAQKLVDLMKIPEDKQHKTVLIMKGTAVGLAILVLIYVLITQ